MNEQEQQPTEAKQKNWFARHKIITGFLIFILFIFVVGWFGEEPTTSSTSNKSNGSSNITATENPTPSPIVLSAVDLVQEYDDNEVKADTKYKGKLVEVSGTVKDIGVVFGSTYVTLSSGEEFSISDVQCFFESESEIEKVSELQKEESVTLRGTVDGKSMNVGVNDCVIVE